MASIWSQDSSSSRSSTPQVKAPCDPPPCSARSISCGGRPLPGADSVADIGSTTPSFNAPNAYHQHDETRMVRALELDGDLGARGGSRSRSLPGFLSPSSYVVAAVSKADGQSAHSVLGLPDVGVSNAASCFYRLCENAEPSRQRAALLHNAGSIEYFVPPRHRRRGEVSRPAQGEGVFTRSI